MFENVLILLDSFVDVGLERKGALLCIRHMATEEGERAESRSVFCFVSKAGKNIFFVVLANQLPK